MIVDVNRQRLDLFLSPIYAGQTKSFLVIVIGLFLMEWIIFLLKVRMQALHTARSTYASSRLFQSGDLFVNLARCLIFLSPTFLHVERHRCSAQQLLFSLYHQACLVPVWCGLGAVSRWVPVCFQGTCVLAERGAQAR